MKKKIIFTGSSILLLVLLSGLFTTCYANWSGAQLEAMLYQNINNIPAGASRNVIYKCVHGNEWALNRDTIPFANYSSIFVRSYRSSSVEWFCDFYCFDNDITFYTQNNNIIPSTNFTCTRYRFDVQNSNVNNTTCKYIGESSFTTTTGSFTNTTDTNGQSFTMVFTNNTIANSNNQTIYGLSYVANFKVEDGEHIISGQGDYPLGKGFLGSHWYTNRENLYYAIYKNESEIIINHDINYTEKANGNYEVEYVVPASALENGAEYSVALYNGENLLYKESSVNTIIIGGGSSSGDSGGNGSSIDLTETNNLIIGLGNTIKSGDERIINTIKSGDQLITNTIISSNNEVIKAIESGEKKAEERHGFWKGVYETLFEIPSGEVQEMIEDFYSEANLGDTESGETIAAVTEAINKLQGQPDDFIISWGDIYIPDFGYNHSVKLYSSGDINFSQMCRDNANLLQIKRWINIITGISLLILFIQKFKEQIHKMLRTDVEFIDTRDEQTTVDIVTEDYPVEYVNGANFRRQAAEWYFSNGGPRNKWTWGNKH